ncbi:hypothetical protein T633_3148 [Acinetobacter baumannii MRSN 58]|nr:hypothetical protein ACIN5109_0464 [Acinetobacter baumannii OIFC109]EJO42467.1 hypothetical protein ACINIS123_1869 [Acinetobacter baumannii IS-123]KLT90406.1 hypothetical protein T633_3148 [Acinetobacter baumannii MRSN 58]
MIAFHGCPGSATKVILFTCWRYSPLSSKTFVPVERVAVPLLSGGMMLTILGIVINPH